MLIMTNMTTQTEEGKGTAAWYTAQARKLNRKAYAAKTTAGYLMFTKAATMALVEAVRLAEQKEGAQHT